MGAGLTAQVVTTGLTGITTTTAGSRRDHRLVDTLHLQGKSHGTNLHLALTILTFALMQDERRGRKQGLSRRNVLSHPTRLRNGRTLQLTLSFTASMKTVTAK